MRGWELIKEGWHDVLQLAEDRLGRRLHVGTGGTGGEHRCCQWVAETKSQRVA